MNIIRSLALLMVILAVITNVNTVYAQSNYDFRGYTSSLDVTELGITFNYTGTCQAQMSSRHSFTTLSGSFDSTITWRSPDATILGFTTQTGLSNSTCQPYGTTALKAVSADDSSGYYETAWSVTHSADSGYVNTMSRFFCASNGYRTNFFVSNGSDSRGNSLYGTRVALSNQRIPFLNTLSTNYNRCGDLTDWSASGDSVLSFGATCTDCQKTAQYIYPLNSSATGDVIYNITENIIKIFGEPVVQQVDITFTLDLINTETQSITNLHTRSTNILTEIQNFNLAEGTLSLVADTPYLLVFTFNTSKAGGVHYAFTTYGPTIDLSIFTFRPDYLCGSFGPCLNGSQSQVCEDQLGVAPDEIRTRSCFDVPAVDIDLGFEEFYNKGVWICQKDYWLVTCTERLETITARYPTNWTVVGSDIGGSNLENFVSISQDWATKGSSSLKMWYYPPKNEEPVAPTPTCGNATTGRFAEISREYNETLFISTNVSFASPYIQMRFDVKKCNLPVVQYDYGTWFACGEKCYSNNCTLEPSGRYGIRISEISERCDITYPLFDFYDDLDNNETVNVTDGNNNTYSEFGSLLGATINSTEDIFSNGTILNFTLNVTGGLIPICIYNDSVEITRFTVPTANTLYSYLITLGNLTGETNEISFVQCNPPARTVRMRTFHIIDEHIHIITEDIVLDYFDIATLQTQNKIIDLSNINLETGANYTIAIAVNPENQFDPNAHCIYLDDFSITFTELALPVCESYCDGLTHYSATELESGICEYTITAVSGDCVTDPNIQEAIENEGNFEYDDNYYIWNNQTGLWEIVDVPELTPEEAQQLSLYDPPLFAQEILLGFGLTQATYGYVWFFFSLFMIINYIALGLGIAVTVFLIPLTQTNQPQVGSATDKTFIPFMVVVVMILVGATFSGWYPLEIGIPVIVAIGLLLWKTMEKVVGGER